MIYVIGGEDVLTSRTKLLLLIGKDTQVIRIDGKKNTLPEILDSFESNSLFAKKRTIVLEFFTKVKPEKVLLEKARQFLNDPDTVLILWDEADLGKTISGELKGANFQSFVFPKFFYQFLDSVSPKNKEASVRILNSLLKNFTPEQVLYSLTKRTRMLSVLKEGLGGEFSESKKLAPWQLAKLTKQANEWTREQLANFLIKLSEADEKLKTSGLTMPLAGHLDIILLSDLN